MSKKAKAKKNKASGGGLAADALKSKSSKKTSSRAEWLTDGSAPLRPATTACSRSSTAAPEPPSADVSGGVSSRPSTLLWRRI